MRELDIKEAQEEILTGIKIVVFENTITGNKVRYLIKKSDAMENISIILYLPENDGTESHVVGLVDQSGFFKLPHRETDKPTNIWSAVWNRIMRREKEPYIKIYINA